MVKLLLLETSTEVCSVSVAENQNVVMTKSNFEKNSHTEHLTLMIEEVVKTVGWTLKELDAIVVSDGPGSYTSLRIGASTAKALCYALGIPLLAIDSLTILSQAIDRLLLTQESLVVPMIDARRMEVYMSIFRHDGTPLLEKQAVILAEDTFENYKNDYKNLYLCGNGAQKYFDNFPSSHLILSHTQTCSSYMAELSYEKYLKKEVDNVAYFSPFYLKNPNITESKKKLWA